MTYRRLFLIGLRVVVGIALIVVLLRQANSEDLRSTLLQVRPLEFLAAVCCLVLGAALNAVRWHTVLHQLDCRLAHSTALVGTFEGTFFNLFLPTSIGGDAMRAYRAFDHGASAKAAIESGLIDRAIGLWGIGLSLLLAVPFAGDALAASSYGAVVSISIAIVAGGALTAVIGRLINPGWFRSWMRPVAHLIRNYGRVATSSRFLTTILPTLMLSVVLTCGAMWLTTDSLDLDHSLLEAAIVVQASTLAALLPVSFGGWGVREGVMVFLLTGAGAATSSAVAASLLFGLALAILGAIGAVVWFRSPYRGLAPSSAIGMRRKGPGTPTAQGFQE